MPPRPLKVEAAATPPFMQPGDSSGFGSEEWEDWMKWDDAAAAAGADDLSSTRGSERSPLFSSKGYDGLSPPSVYSNNGGGSSQHHTPPSMHADDFLFTGGSEFANVGSELTSPTFADEDFGGKDSDQSPPSLRATGSNSSSNSPSEPDNTHPMQLSPVYEIPPQEPPPGSKAGSQSKKRKSSAINGGSNNGQATKQTRTSNAGNGAAAKPAKQTPIGTSTRQPRGQKISHNVIEKRYRTNLNDKIARLRDSVPELRTAAPTVKRRPAKPSKNSDSEGSGDESSNLKFNKATVLTKATEYIQQLERQNQRLLSELSMLRSRAGPIDRLQNPDVIPPTSTDSLADVSIAVKATGSAVPCALPPVEAAKAEAGSPAGLIKVPDYIRKFREQTGPQESYAPTSPTENTPQEDEKNMAEVFKSARGMIPQPDDWRKLREGAYTQDKRHFAPPAPQTAGGSSQFSLQDTTFASSAGAFDFEAEGADESSGSFTLQKRNKVLSRLLVGSLAALMLMEGFSESDGEPAARDASGHQKRDSHHRGLFALPSELLTESRGFRAPIRQRIINFFASPVGERALPMVVISTIFLAVFFAIFLYLAPKESKNVREGPCPNSVSLTGMYPGNPGSLPSSAPSSRPMSRSQSFSSPPATPQQQQHQHSRSYSGGSQIGAATQPPPRLTVHPPSAQTATSTPPSPSPRVPGSRRTSFATQLAPLTPISSRTQSYALPPPPTTPTIPSTPTAAGGPPPPPPANPNTFTTPPPSPAPSYPCSRRNSEAGLLPLTSPTSPTSTQHLAPPIPPPIRRRASATPPPRAASSWPAYFAYGAAVAAELFGAPWLARWHHLDEEKGPERGRGRVRAGDEVAAAAAVAVVGVGVGEKREVG